MHSIIAAYYAKQVHEILLRNQPLLNISLALSLAKKCGGQLATGGLLRRFVATAEPLIILLILPRATNQKTETALLPRSLTVRMCGRSSSGTALFTRCHISKGAARP